MERSGLQTRRHVSRSSRDYIPGMHCQSLRGQECPPAPVNQTVGRQLLITEGWKTCMDTGRALFHVRLLGIMGFYGVD